MELKNTTIYRGGNTASYLGYEDTNCYFDVGYYKSLELYFSIKSKGGGRTDIKVAISDDDFSSILEDVAFRKPSMLRAFTKASQIASESILENNKSLHLKNDKLEDKIIDLESDIEMNEYQYDSDIEDMKNRYNLLKNNIMTNIDNLDYYFEEKEQEFENDNEYFQSEERVMYDKVKKIIDILNEK